MQTCTNVIQTCKLQKSNESNLAIFYKHYEPQLVYGATLSNVELADMPGVKTFRPGATNAVWSFNWHRPKKDFMWKESVEYEQDDWLNASKLPVEVLQNMVKATNLDSKNNDRRGELMSAGATYFQQLAKKKQRNITGPGTNSTQQATSKMHTSSYKQACTTKEHQQ